LGFGKELLDFSSEFLSSGKVVRDGKTSCAPPALENILGMIPRKVP